MGKVFLLQHSYEIYIQGVSKEQTKILGIYSTKEKAEEVIQRYKSIVGFNRFPITCFYVDDYDLDKDHWTEGFVRTDEIMEDFRIITACFNRWLNVDKTPEESWENDNYYNALCEIKNEVYNVKSAGELAAHISLIWSLRFKESPKSEEECIGIANIVLQSIKLNIH
jgi:hypothetical protein